MRIGFRNRTQFFTINPFRKTPVFVENQNSLEQSIRHRRTVSRYQLTEIDPSIFTKWLELSVLAPNHKHTFPWSVIRLTGQSKIQLKDWGREVRKRKGLLEDENLLNELWVHPEVFIFAQKLSSDPKTSQEDYATVSCSIYAFMLQAIAFGFQSKWTTGQMIQGHTLYKIAGLSEEDHAIVGLITVGVPASPAGPQRRPPLSSYFREIA